MKKVRIYKRKRTAQKPDEAEYNRLKLGWKTYPLPRPYSLAETYAKYKDKTNKNKPVFRKTAVNFHAEHGFDLYGAPICYRNDITGRYYMLLHVINWNNGNLIETAKYEELK